MIPLADVIAGLKRNQLALKFALEREVRLGMEAAAVEARSFIGNEQPGWAALADSTIAEKQRLGYPTPHPLERTGELKDSISGEAETIPGGVHGVVGSTSDLAILHEVGTSRMPARPFLGPALMLTEPKIAVALAELAVRTLTPGSRP